MIIGQRAHLSFYNCRFIYSLNTDRFFVSTKQFVVYANNIEPQAEYQAIGPLFLLIPFYL